MKAILMSAVVLTVMAFVTEDKLIGRWQTKPSEKGNTTSVVFKSNNTFEGFINKKPFVTGEYTFRDSIFSFVDNGCEGKRGVYKVIFFSNEDSLRLVPISDSCDRRREGMIRLVMGRVK